MDDCIVVVHVVRSDCEVFPKNQAAPFSKVLTFYRKEAFPLEAYYSDPKGLPHPNATIGTQLQ
jgi:heat shock protein 4